MTVKELTEMLSHFPQQMNVYISYTSDYGIEYFPPETVAIMGLRVSEPGGDCKRVSDMERERGMWKEDTFEGVVID